MLTVGSLFAGIGGIDLAFEAAGFRIAWQVEIDDFCTDILSKRWPDVPRYRDVRECGAHNLARCDVLTGGFPCQDISVAGQGAGILAGTRSGLWFEFARIIGELRPRLVLLENVPAITTRDGTVVLGSLAALGYDARWGVISAADAGASHQRERWWCVAFAQHPRPPLTGRGHESKGAQRGALYEGRKDGGQLAYADGRRCEQRDTAIGRVPEPDAGGLGDTSGAGLAQREGQRRDDGTQLPSTERAGGDDVADTASGQRHNGRGYKPLEGVAKDGLEGRAECPESRLGRGADGLSAWLDESYSRLHVARPGQLQHEWEPPRVASGQSGRVNRLKALGNAVVPQVVYPIAVMMHKWLEEAD